MRGNKSSLPLKIMAKKQGDVSIYSNIFIVYDNRALGKWEYLMIIEK